MRIRANDNIWVYVGRGKGAVGKLRVNCEDPSYLYISPIIFRFIKPRRKNWEGHVHYWREERYILVYTEFYLGILRERNHLVNPNAFEGIILKFFLRNWNGLSGLDCGSCE